MKKLLLLALPMLFFALSFSSCEKDPCSSVPCLNGGFCNNGTCECPTGYSGVNCQDFDPCATVTCLNGGICDNGSCDCPTGYSGIDCSVLLTPTSMTIRRIDVTSYPTTSSNGSSWDPFDGADPFVVFHPGTTSNYDPQNAYISGSYSNVTGQALSFDNGLPKTINGLSSYWSLDMFDQDASVHDHMAGVYFKPINQSNGFPSSFQLQTSNITATLYVTWNF